MLGQKGLWSQVGHRGRRYLGPWTSPVERRSHENSHHEVEAKGRSDFCGPQDDFETVRFTQPLPKRPWITQFERDSSSRDATKRRRVVGWLELFGVVGGCLQKIPSPKSQVFPRSRRPQSVAHSARAGQRPSAAVHPRTTSGASPGSVSMVLRV